MGVATAALRASLHDDTHATSIQPGLLTYSYGSLTDNPVLQGPIESGQYTWEEIEAGLGPIYETATTIAVHFELGSSTATTSSDGTVSQLTLGYANAADPVTYGFGGG